MEEKSSKLFEKEAAIFLPSGLMGNLIASKKNKYIFKFNYVVFDNLKIIIGLLLDLKLILSNYVFTYHLVFF